jgi:hypothetical protein
MASCHAELEGTPGGAEPAADAAAPAPDGGADAAIVTPPDLSAPRDLARPAADLASACPTGPRDCSPGPGSGEPDTCKKIEPCFFTAVRDSVVRVLRDHPDWVDESSGLPIVLKPEEYMNAVVAEVNGRGLCAIRDPNAGDEVAVKRDNGFAESFDILAAAGNARWGAGIYTATCAPAWF